MATLLTAILMAAPGLRVDVRTVAVVLSLLILRSIGLALIQALGIA